jgi:hypothetical protein
MDTQPTPQFSPEKSIGGEINSAPMPSNAEAGSTSSNNNASQPTQMNKPVLTAADVAAAMAAVPTPAAPLPSDYAPTVAADQDVIEPEWVDRAEQVVSETAGNPFAEEEGIEALQIDYLKKRYGYEVKKSSNG